MTLALTLMMLAAPLRAEAHHKPNVFCSPSGDVCQSTQRVDGVRWLRIGLAAEYFSEYRLCVRAPNDSVTCRHFRIHDLGATFGSSVRWARSFPYEGPGAYVVVWWTGGHQVGHRLGFHR